MAPRAFLLFALCAIPFCLTSAKTTNLVINASWQPRATFDGYQAAGGDPIDDCTTEGDIIREAFRDALSLATTARDVILNRFPSGWHGSLYSELFRDKGGAYSRAKIASVYNGIASNDGLPDEIIFHCGGGWAAAMNRRLTTYGYKSHGTMDCSDPYDVAYTEKIRSGDFPPDMFSDFGPQGAFRSGIHITLCPKFFTKLSLSALRPVARGLYINSQSNQAWVMLHELAHASDGSIKDGGYGYDECIKIANEIIPWGGDNVYAIKNADTYALFAMSVTPVQDMDKWKWSGGGAARVPP